MASSSLQIQLFSEFACGRCVIVNRSLCYFGKLFCTSYFQDTKKKQLKQRMQVTKNMMIMIISFLMRAFARSSRTFRKHRKNAITIYNLILSLIVTGIWIILPNVLLVHLHQILHCRFWSSWRSDHQWYIGIKWYKFPNFVWFLIILLM